MATGTKNAYLFQLFLIIVHVYYFISQSALNNIYICTKLLIFYYINTCDLGLEMVASNSEKETWSYNSFISSGRKGTTDFETTVFREVVIEVAAEAGN